MTNLSQVSIVWPSTFQTSIPLKLSIEINFHMEPLWVGRTKVPPNDLGHMTEMAVITIYGNKKCYSM